MNKKYLTFLSAILIATISACGGSQPGDAPRQQDDPKSNPDPVPEPVRLTVEEVNVKLQKFNRIEPQEAYPKIRKDKELWSVIEFYCQNGFELIMDNKTYFLMKNQ